MTGDRGDTVAVVIAAHEAGKFIGRAVRSALAEPEVAEVFVVDDASTDDTVAATHAADDGSGRLVVLQQPANLGPGAARNRGLEVARSTWIAILDSDDYFLPGRLATLLVHARDADLVADDPFAEPEGAAGGGRERVLGIDMPLELTFASFVRGNISRAGRERRELGYLQPLMRRAFLRDHALAHREHMRLGEDYELYARALARGARFTVIPAVGYVCVRREGSLSARHSIADLEHLRDCDADLAAIPGLSPEDRGALSRHVVDIECRVRWRRFLQAVAGGRLLRAMACFIGPWPVPFYLLRLSFWTLRLVCGRIAGWHAPGDDSASCRQGPSDASGSPDSRRARSIS